VCERIIFADTGSEALIDSLVTLGPSLDQKAVLFPCEDKSVLQVSRHRQTLETWYHLALASEEVVEMLMNKVAFYTYAQENGFPIPPTRLLASRADAERASAELAFPCILKPPVSATPEWEAQSKLKAYRVSTGEQLLTLYDQLKGLADILIAQEWIQGPDSNLYSCNCYFDGNSEPQVTFVARKLRQWPPETGESCLGQECRDDTVLEETVRLFRSVGYRGLGYVEMKRHARSGEYLIIEPNIGRPTGRSAIAEAGGVELLYTMYCDLVGWPLPDNRQQEYGSVKWIYLRRDLQSSLYHWRRGELTVADWLESLRGPKAYAIFSWRDPGPFIADWQRSIRLFTSARERSKRDYRNPLSQPRQV
jgi:predicted ATP-grasp superfamily ATP-dependent carboligase